MLMVPFRDLLDGKIPSDLALLQDAEIRQYVEQYATDQVNTFSRYKHRLLNAKMLVSPMLSRQDVVAYVCMTCPHMHHRASF